MKVTRDEHQAIKAGERTSLIRPGLDLTIELGEATLRPEGVEDPIAVSFTARWGKEYRFMKERDARRAGYETLEALYDHLDETHDLDPKDTVMVLDFAMRDQQLSDDASASQMQLM